MINLIITGILIILTIVFGLLKSFWSGFVYFCVSCLVVLFTYWLIVLIKSYIENYYKGLNEKYKIYCANLVNSSSLSLQEIEQNNHIYFSQFKKTLRKEKFIEILKMLVVISLIAVCIGLFFSGKMF